MLEESAKSRACPALAREEKAENRKTTRRKKIIGRRGVLKSQLRENEITLGTSVVSSCSAA